MNILSIFRHWFTLFATAATLWLVSAFALSADESKTLCEAFGSLLEPVLIIGTLLITAGWRIALAWLSKLFRNGTGEMENGGPSGGAALLIVVGTAAVLGGLPSCSPAQIEAARGFPIRGCVVTDQGAVCYSSKGGLSYEVDARSGK